MRSRVQAAIGPPVAARLLALTLLVRLLRWVRVGVGNNSKAAAAGSHSSGQAAEVG